MTEIEQENEVIDEIDNEEESEEEIATTAYDVVNAIFGDNRLDTLTSVSDLLNAKAFDAIQQKKIEFANQWGFDYDNSAQAVADELTDELPDNTDIPGDEQPEEVETDETDS